MNVAVYPTYLSVEIDNSSRGEFLAIRKLSDCYYDKMLKRWIVPIRMGTADLLADHEVLYWTAGIVRELENEMIAQRQAIDIWNFPIAEALAVAVLDHLRSAHFQDVQSYNDNHPNYKEIQDEKPKSRRKKDQVSQAATSQTAPADRLNSEGSQSRRRKIFERS